jgi:trk system potassium uptake protein TrkH
MNIKLILKSLGNIFKTEAILMLLPLIVSLIYKENIWYSYLIPSVVTFVLGFFLARLQPERQTLYAREGFSVVGLCWICLSLFGCVPFMISGAIPNFFDAFFETVSGFTTTGSTILENVEILPKSVLFWRSFTHWIGGMGILVFVLAILPNSDGQNIYILRAESTGPQVGKLVSKLRVTARILYLIYFAFTVIEILLLYFGDKVFGSDGIYKMDLIASLVHTFGTVGTGGFSIKADGLASYSTYSQMLISVFMLICGINFNVFYLILIGKFKQVLKCEEMWWYLGTILISTVSIALNIYFSLEDILLASAFKDSFFHVTSIMTSTGFATVDFNNWPAFSQSILWVLMFVGACAGSTGG